MGNIYHCIQHTLILQWGSVWVQSVVAWLPFSLKVHSGKNSWWELQNYEFSCINALPIWISYNQPYNNFSCFCATELNCISINTVARPDNCQKGFCFQHLNMSLKLLFLLCLISLCLGLPHPAPQEAVCADRKFHYLNFEHGLLFWKYIFLGSPPDRGSSIAGVGNFVRRFNNIVRGFQRSRSGNPYRQNYRQTGRGFYQPVYRYRNG